MTSSASRRRVRAEEPRVRAEEPHRATPRDEGAAAGSRGADDGEPRLLLVEDEAETRAAGAYFEALGYTVDTASSASEALRRATIAPPDVVIADVQLVGRRTGIDVARHLRERRPSLPIVVLTGLPLEEVERLSAGVGRLTILSKPLRLLELHELIQRLLGTS